MISFRKLSRLQKMLTVLGCGIVASLAWNYYYFFILKAVDPEARKQQYTREMEADPLFSDTAKYETMRNDGATRAGGGAKSGHDKSKDGTRAPMRDTSPAAAQLVRPKSRKRFLERLSQNAEATQTTALRVKSDRLSGVIEVTALGAEPQEVSLSIIADAPAELSVDALIAGEKRIWLREIEADLRNHTTLVSDAEEVNRFTGKAKAYVEYASERIRIVVDIVVDVAITDSTSDETDEEGVWEARFTVKRGERSENEYPFVDKEGEDFNVFLSGTTSGVVPEAPALDAAATPAPEATAEQKLELLE